ncbi:MAG: hypothetical protein QOH12_3208, partial [Solirubrobacteraceae bacterium]|nr:hypothetical protein [Solirubrobacteraceae bacterium]
MAARRARRRRALGLAAMETFLLVHVPTLVLGLGIVAVT